MLSRIRAGVLEQTTVDVLRANGLAERLDREGQHAQVALAEQYAGLPFEGVARAGQSRRTRDRTPAPCSKGLADNGFGGLTMQLKAR